MTSATFGNANSGFQVGINQGPIYLSQERTEPRFEPLSTVPFQRDPDFVCRDALLYQIHEKASIPGSRTVLVGLGGVGKTQLAIEYCHWLREKSPETCTFWVHASNLARCKKSLRDLADRVRIPGREDRNADIFQLVGNWLQDKRIGKWILILDNVDDDELLRNPLVPGTKSQASGLIDTSMEPPLRYLLESLNGSIIVTSRSKGVALDIAGPKNLIEVQPMEKAEAVDLLQKKADIPAESEDIVHLLEALEFMPLAIAQAAAYIVHSLPRCSVSQYLEKIQKSDREVLRLLSYEAGLLHRDWEAKNSILLTWQISFDHIHRVRPSATDLLSLMSLFDRQGIPESILRVQQNQKTYGNEYSREEDDSSSEEDGGSLFGSDTDQCFEDDIRMLSDYSLISISKEGAVFTMHRLVQLTVRIWLRTNGQIEQWKKMCVSNLCCVFPISQYDHWEICRSLFPHIKSAVSNRPESRESLEQWATLLYRGAEYAQKSGNIADATEMALKSRKQRLKLFGPESLEVVQSNMVLATAYRDEGRWQEAERLFVQVIEARKTKLGEDHADTLSSIDNLASTYREQGRWEEAEQLDVQVMEIRKKLGDGHPDFLTSMANLASTYWNQGRWKEAEQLEVRVMEIRKTKLGEDHPETLMSMADLAATYRQQGRLGEAEQLLTQVTETYKTKLGEDHPHTLISTANLTSIYLDQGRCEKAEQLFIQVIQNLKSKLGENHPYTLSVMANLASTYRDQGRRDEAEQLFVQVMEARKTKLGEGHPDTISIMSYLASTYRDQGRLEDAEQLDVQLLEAHKTKLGEGHPHTLSLMTNIASTYWKQGRTEEAEQLEVRMVEALKIKLGEDHPHTLSSMANLALTYWYQDRWKEAEQLQIRVMETRKTKLGEDHPDTLSSMADLASTWKSVGRKASASRLLRVCISKQQLIIGPDHLDTLSNSNTLLEWETGELSIN